MISVIVPIYNVEKYLHEAIRSLLNQTYTDLEIILVDDGSTDNSGRICDEYSKLDNRIKVIHQKNRGLSGARNAGLDVCHGDMIAFLDSDDAYCPDMLSSMAKVMNTSGADIVECNFSVYKGDNSMNSQVISLKPKGLMSCENCKGLYSGKEALHMQIDGKIANNVWNKLYKNKIWRDLRFREGHNYEDVDLILDILGMVDSFYFLDDSLIMYRKRKGSISSTHTIKNLRDRVCAYEHYRDYVEDHVPEYFTEENYAQVITRIYKLYIVWYFDLAYKLKKECKECMHELRLHIDNVEKMIDIKRSDKFVRTSSLMYHHLPAFMSGLFYRAYDVYKNIRQIFFHI